MPRLTLLGSMATRALLAELAQDHARRTGVGVEAVAMGGVDAAKRVRAGDAIDVAVLASGSLAALEAEGFVAAGSLADVARSDMMAAVPAGRPPPPLGDAADLVAALRGAAAVAHSTGPSGDHLLGLIDRLGLTAELAGRLVQAPPGVPVAALVAGGLADLGFQQGSELVGQPGIALLGPLPPGCGATTTFAAGLCASSSAPEAARELVASLAAPEAAAAKRRHGLEPA